MLGHIHTHQKDATSMAKWNGVKPLRMPRGEWMETEDKKNVYKITDIAEICRGETLPAAMVTADFIGDTLDNLTALTPGEVRKFEQWKAANPRIAHRWDHLEYSPEQTGAFAGRLAEKPEKVP